ncbi:hypothetical protein QDT73_15215 [Acinetobacter baumannii]|uniref:hypothetical protein n=1 Tax=Acinetobacter baumannii TaxID=470 RepID=UPI002449C76C|nr:hypothetical protein [Acinetobacter baumannii]MDH2568701.1 hypothetical protein [Acinetobacter baumannii]
MKNLENLFEELDQLQQVVPNITLKETNIRLTIIGDNLDQATFAAFKKIISAFRVLATDKFFEDLIIRINEDNLDLDDPQSNIDQYLNQPWRLILAKHNLAELIKARDEEKTILFYDRNSIIEWLSLIDPCSPDEEFEKETTIRVRGETARFGSPLLWVLPIGENTPNNQTENLPDDETVQGLIHVMALNKTVRISPRTFALTWGNLEHDLAKPFIKLGVLALSSCIVQELKCDDTNYKVTLRGLKRLELSLFKDSDTYDSILLKKLIRAVVWIYEERSETRLKLVMDRLSMDIEPTISLVNGMNLFLDEALQQAKDSYAFVILERKDAYHKEMRDLLKDMKSQADMYAAKVRDLVSSLTRDILGILIFVALSFISKFDQNNLTKLINSIELSTFLKFLSGYLILSGTLQIVSHLRDANLSYEESQQWLGILQNYTSKNDNQEKFIDPITKRRKTLFIAMFLCGLIYIGLAIAIWNLPTIIHYLIPPELKQ